MMNHSELLNHFQGIPGGEAALQRLYQDVSFHFNGDILQKKKTWDSFERYHLFRGS